MFLLWLRQLPWYGDWTPASGPPPTEGSSSPTNTPGFPPSSFILLRFVWFYVFFCSDQVLLTALSWCSVCTSVSEGVLLICLWREMYSTSTCSSTILFSHLACWYVTMGIYIKAQVLVKVNSAILDLVGSNQFSYGLVIPNKIHLSNKL